jgi:iron(III) transport system permease protein
VIAAGIVIPVVVVVLASVSNPTYGIVGNYGTKYLSAMVHADQFASLLRTTLIYTVAGTVMAVAIAAMLAWITTLTNIPFARVLRVLPLAPLLFPPLLLVTAWVQLYGGRAGYVNVLLQDAFHTQHTFTDIFGLRGMIVAVGLNMVPLPYLILSAAMRSINTSLPEASYMSGASIPKTLLRIQLPLLRPALLSSLALVGLVIAGSFEIPFVMGAPKNVNTFTSRIYESLSSGEPNFNLAAAQADVYLVLNGLLLLWYVMATRRENRFQTVSARGGNQRIDLGRWKYLVMLVPVAYVLVAVAQLLIQSVLVSFQKFFTTTQGFPYRYWTLGNYRDMAKQNLLVESFTNTIKVDVIVTVLTVVVSLFICLVAFNTTIFGRRTLEVIATSPVAVPPVVMSVALLITVLIIPGLRSTYSTLTPVIAVEVILFIPFAVRTISGSIIQIPRELREAAAMCGAGPWRGMLTVTIPLIRQAVYSAILIVFVLSFRELAGIALLTAANAPMVASTALDYWETGQPGLVGALNIAMFVFPILAAGLMAGVIAGVERGLTGWRRHRTRSAVQSISVAAAGIRPQVDAVTEMK